MSQPRVRHEVLSVGCPDLGLRGLQLQAIPPQPGFWVPAVSVSDAGLRSLLFQEVAYVDAEGEQPDPPSLQRSELESKEQSLPKSKPPVLSVSVRGMPLEVTSDSDQATMPASLPAVGGTVDSPRTMGPPPVPHKLLSKQAPIAPPNEPQQDKPGKECRSSLRGEEKPVKRSKISSDKKKAEMKQLLQDMMPETASEASPKASPKASPQGPGLSIARYRTETFYPLSTGAGRKSFGSKSTSVSKVKTSKTKGDI